MSGSNSGTVTEPSSWTPATDEELASGAVLFAGVIPPGTTYGNIKSLARTATANQLAAFIQTGTILGEESTYGAVSTTFPGLPSIPSAGGNVTVQGFITAQDKAGGGFAKWTISFPAVRDPNATTCFVPPTLSGDAPVCGPEFAYGTLSNLGAPALGANSAGPIISPTGVAGLSIVWGLNVTFTEVNL